MFHIERAHVLTVGTYAHPEYMRTGNTCTYCAQPSITYVKSLTTGHSNATSAPMLALTFFGKPMWITGVVRIRSTIINLNRFVSLPKLQQQQQLISVRVLNALVHCYTRVHARVTGHRILQYQRTLFHKIRL